MQTQSQDDAARIRANVEKMRAQKATDDEIEHYLSNVEGLKPATPAMAPRESSSVRPDYLTDKAKAAASPAQFGSGLLRSAEQGATFGFGDEINAGVRALGTDTYANALTDERAKLAAYKSANPGTALVAELGGAIGGGGLAGAGAKALGLGARAVSGGLNVTRAQKALALGKQLGVGAGAGGLTAAGTSDGSVSDRIGAIPRGAAFGAGVVAGLRGLGAASNATGVTALARGILPRPASGQSVAGRVVQRAGGMTTRDLAHADILKQAERARVPLDELATRAAAAHPDDMLMDVIGQPAVDRAGGAVATPSRGSADIVKALDDRAQRQPGVVQSAIERGFGHSRDNAIERAQQLAGQRVARNSPAYEAIKDIEIDDPDVLSLFDIREFRNVHRDVARNAKIRGDRKILPLTSRRKAGGETVRVYHGNESGALDGGVYDLSRSGTGALSDIDKRHFEPAIYTTTSKPHAAGYGTPIELDVQLKKPLKVDAHAELEHWRKSEMPQYDSVQDMVDDYYDGEVYQAFGADERFLEFIKRAKRDGNDAVVVDFGDLHDAVTDSEIGKVVISLDPRSVREASSAAVNQPTRIRNPQTLGTLDKMKQHIDDIIRGKIDGGKVSRDRAYALRDRLIAARDRLDELHPDYKAARAGWAEDSGLIDAHEAGRNFGKTSTDELEATFPGRSAGEQEEFRRGALSDVEETLSRVADGRNVALKFQNPQMRAKLRAVFPDEASYDAFYRDLDALSLQHTNRAQVVGNSKTASRLAQMAEAAGPSEGISAVGNAVTGNAPGVLASLARSGVAQRFKGLSADQVDALAPLLTASGPELDAVIRELQAVAQRQAVSRASTRSSRLAGQLAGATAATSPRRP